ncbi:MAG: hypothetical protein CL846_01800 [Crocinitomicaceae bacterium]|nr:hypothetical protein [Crocinitomicaceae bacterium]
MKKLLLLFTIVAFMASCGPSLCDCVNESMKGEISEACEKMEEKMMKLEGDELEAKMKEAEECMTASMDNNIEDEEEDIIPNEEEYNYEDEEEYEYDYDEDGDEEVDSDDSGSSEFDEAMDEYEAFIDDYIVMMKKAMDLQKDPEAMMNDPMAAMKFMEDAQKLAKEAEEASEKLEAAMDDFTSEQAERYMRLVTKLSEAASSMY